MERNWYQPEDHTAPIITAREHVRSAHGGADAPLPETCVLFEMGMAMRHLKKRYKTRVLSERLPCFLENPSVLSLKGERCFLCLRAGAGLSVCEPIPLQKALLEGNLAI